MQGSRGRFSIVVVFVCTVSPGVFARPFVRSTAPAPTTAPDSRNRTKLDEFAFCSDLMTMLRCQIDALKKRKDESESSAAKVKTLQDLQAQLRAAGLSDDLTAKVREASAAASEAKKSFTPDDEKELARLQKQLDYVGEYCSYGGWPPPWYALRLGAEGTWSADRTLSDGKPVLDFYFAAPLFYLRTTNAKVKVIEVCRDDKGFDRLSTHPAGSDSVCPNRSTSLPAELLKLEDSKRSEIDGRQKNAKKDIAKAEADVKAATAERDKDAESARTDKTTVAAVADELERNRKIATSLDPCSAGKGQVSECQRRVVLANWLAEVKARSVESSKSLADAERTLARAQKALEEARTSLNGVSAADPVCGAVTDVEERIRALERQHAPDESDPAEIVGTRIGPYIIPDRLKLQSAPIWGYVRVRSESIPNVAKAKFSEDGTGNYASPTIGGAETRPTVAVGLYYSWTLGRSTVAGPYVQAGSIVGSLPDGRGRLWDHLFYSAGLSLQTNYAVADVDRQKDVSTVVGVLSAGYGYERFLGNYSAVTTLGEKIPTKDAARLQVDFRLNWSKLSSKAIAPFVFLSLDRSLHGSLHRDRGGILFEVDLDTVFGSAVDSASKTAGLSSSK